MQPTINVNLGGLQFTLNDCAYRLMDEYLNSLAEVFRAQHLDAEELVADIEVRCAEILSSEHDRFHYIITEGDINALIDRMGRPEEIMEEQVTESAGYENINVKETFVKPPVYPMPNQPLRKRLYRIRQGAELGGVCGGIAEYCGWDPTYVRIATIILAFLSASTIASAYLILWIVIPQAKTPLQEMELRGESPTLNNIGNTVKQAFGFGSNKKDSKNSACEVQFEKLTPDTGKKNVKRTNRFFSGLMKVLMALAGLIFILITAGLVVIFITYFCYGIIEFFNTHNTPINFGFYLSVLGLGCLVVGIPLSFCVYLISGALFRPNRDRRMKPAWRLALFIVWTIAVILCVKVSRFYQSMPLD